MNANISRLYDNLLQLAASSQTLGINLIRVAILIVFVWIGGLKFQNYEAEGIVPFVANSPFMSFFSRKKHPSTKTTNSKRGNSTPPNTNGTSGTTPTVFRTGSAS